MAQLLENNTSSNAFDSYQVFWDEERNDIDLKYTLETDYDFVAPNKAFQQALRKEKESIKQESGSEFDNGDEWNGDSSTQLSGSQKGGKGQGSSDYEFQVTNVTWNCNGSTLAVAYGKTNLVSWCEYHSCVSLWGIFRREFNAKKPHENIEVDNCLTTLAFHPTNPSVLAGGSHDGIIYIWNTFTEEPLYCKTEIDEYYHRECI
jgi:WD40 repeat protein